MRNWKQYHAKKAARSEAGRRAANVRWERYHADMPERDVRNFRITIEDSHEPMRVIMARQVLLDNGRWSRLRVAGSRGRPVSRNGLAKRVAAALV